MILAKIGGLKKKSMSVREMNWGKEEGWLEWKRDKRAEGESKSNASYTCMKRLKQNWSIKKKNQRAERIKKKLFSDSLESYLSLHLLIKLNS